MFIKLVARHYVNQFSKSFFGACSRKMLLPNAHSLGRYVVGVEEGADDEVAIQNDSIAQSIPLSSGSLVLASRLVQRCWVWPL